MRDDTTVNPTNSLAAQQGSPGSAGVDVRLEGIGLAFPSRTAPGTSRWAVKNVSCTFPAGELCSIIGPSGCGKSTLLSIISGLLPPTSGSVRIGGRPASGINPDLGFMFQKDTLVPWRTALDNVMMPLEIAGRPDPSVAAGLLAKLGLHGFEGHYPRELSGGMRKRVQLARLLAQDPGILLMDEPFGALDAQTKLVIHEEFLRLWEESRQTVLFVTHDLTEAILLSDRILLVSPGPGTIRAEYPVPIPRPRHVETVMESPVFHRLFREIWTALRQST
ncbi:MAG: ABC transporter ATP-binding protein [Betaproteobacteria bacterium]|nr:ABC transporter ATP-binding protein [Betaproteobacteria bacterium]